MPHLLQPIPGIQFSGGTVTMPPVPGPGMEVRTGTLTEAVNAWRHQGAGWVHIDDSDAAGGGPANLDQITEAVHHHSGHLKIEVAGGITDADSLNAVLAAGVTRAVIDVGAAADQDWVRQALVHHQDRVAAGLSVQRDELVAPDGTGLGTVWDIAMDLDAIGCPHFVVTEAEHKGHWFHRDKHVLAAICESVKHPVTAHGGIKHLGDLHQLSELVKDGLEAAIITEPLYSGQFTYPEPVSAIEGRFDPYEWAPPQP